MRSNSIRHQSHELSPVPTAPPKLFRRALKRGLPLSRLDRVESQKCIAFFLSLDSYVKRALICSISSPIACNAWISCSRATASSGS